MLTKKYGPFPLWVWLVLGVAAYYFWSKYKASGGTLSGGGVNGRGTNKPHGHQRVYSNPPMQQGSQQMPYGSYG